jgi:hypothetical protein
VQCVQGMVCYSSSSSSVVRRQNDALVAQVAVEDRAVFEGLCTI